jgi:hypothetical protein
MSVWCQQRKRQTSFDHLVGERQQVRGHGDAKRFRGLEIDNEGKLARLLDREITRLGAIQNFRGISASTTQTIHRVGCVGHGHGQADPARPKSAKPGLMC